ncbi:hypothetical protein JCM33374_g1999 [Metschnikowia sp. JCM 33374]|nr:hypothetical protein JCM33374_g1999 [Metschnikowia sp. JCM 33374]
MSDTSDSSRTSRSSVSSRSSPMATIESSVTRLLVSTKHLLESLTQWARQEADDKFVSDAYVKLGNDFRAAARSFTNAGVDISDLGDVPKALRIVLESALSEAPTQENLDKFLPNIRSIIVTLLSNLKAKQSRAKEIAAEHSMGISSTPAYPTTHSRNPSKPTRSTSDMVPPTISVSAPAPRSNGRYSDGFTDDRPRDRTSAGAAAATSNTERPRRSRLLAELQVKANSDTLATLASNEGDADAESADSADSADSGDALAKLQKGNVISRRASKRFSAYQFAKLANLNNNHVPRMSAELTVPSQGEGLSHHYQNQHTPPPEVPHLPARSSHSPAPPDAKTHNPFIFLRIEDKTKKVHVQFPMTMASLRLLFVEKFAYSPKTASFPEIYLLDSHSNVSFELEEHRVEDEVKHASLVFLKPPRTHEESLKELETSVNGLNLRMDTLASDLVSRVKEVIESAPISTQSSAPVVSEPTKEVAKDSSKDLEARNVLLTKALKALKEELKAVKRISDSRDAQVKELTSAMSKEILTLKEACLEESSPVKNRAFMEESYSKLSEDSDSLLTRVDDLQDMMEALRKDVAQRGVRLSPKQLKSTQKEITEAKLHLSGLIEYIHDGKPSWKKIWESELDKVCEEQQFFNLQDDLTHDLDEDIRKIEETFDLIEKCCVHQSKKASKRNVFASRMMLPEPGESVHNIRDAVLSEVSALKPDHEGRLDAIAKAEKIRERERQIQSLNQFQEELGDFVEEKKFKSAGGIEELEKRRQQQDAENLKSSFGIV